MIDKKISTVRVKTGSTWVKIENVEICYYLSYKDFISSKPDAIDIRYIQVPSWASCWKKTIQDYVEMYPEKLDNSIIEVV